MKGNHMSSYIKDNKVQSVLDNYEELIHAITTDTLKELKESYLEESAKFDYEDFVDYVELCVKGGIGILEDLGREDFIIIAAAYINQTGNLEFDKNTLLRYIHFDILDYIDTIIDSYREESK